MLCALLSISVLFRVSAATYLSSDHKIQSKIKAVKKNAYSNVARFSHHTQQMGAQKSLLSRRQLANGGFPIAGRNKNIIRRQNGIKNADHLGIIVFT